MNEKITLQRVFELAWEHYIVKNEPPGVYEDRRGLYGCTYGPHGTNSCAFGLALKESGAGDHVLSSQVCISEIMDDYPEFFDEEDFRKKLDINGVDTMQSELHDSLVETGRTMHDGGVKPGNWLYPRKIRAAYYVALALKYNLELPDDWTDYM